MAQPPVIPATDRRQFMALGTAVAASLALGGRAFGAAPAAKKNNYAGMMLIDAMGTIGDPAGGPLPESPPSERLLSDLKESGLTAISMTLSVGSQGDRMMK